MNYDELIAAHKLQLMDSAGLFSAADDRELKGHLQTAVIALSKDKRPRAMAATITLQAGIATYALPSDFAMYKSSPWGLIESRTRWTHGAEPPRAPHIIYDDAGPQLHFSPPPTAAQICAYGSGFAFYYAALHVLNSNECTIQPEDKNLLLLRAAVEAMRGLSIRNYSKPTSLRAGSGLGGGMTTKNMTPPALYEQFLKEYSEAA